MDVDHLFRLATGERNDPLYIGRMPEPWHRRIGASARSIYLSSYTLRKNLSRHKEFRLEYFEFVPWMIENGNPVRDGINENTIHFIAPCKAMLNYSSKVTIKTTKRGHELWVTSAHAIRDRDIGRIERRGSNLPERMRPSLNEGFA